MRICFDLDGTLCEGRPYEVARPIPGRKRLLEALKSKKHTIIIYTARGMQSCSGDIGKINKKYLKLTLDQLETWGFPYDEIVFGKPSADLYIDDKALNAVFLSELESLLKTV